MKTWKIDWFLLGMALAVGLAWALPGPGADGGILHPDVLTKAGVALVFFLNGVALSFERLKAGTLRWGLHLMIQICTFVFFPLLGLALLWLAGRWLAPDLRWGFFYLCALPSTVSSSVAMTSAARGNVPVAVFNATLSSLLGIFLTPLWLALVLGHSGGQGMPIGKVVLDLVFWLLLPLLVGQGARRWLADWAAGHKAFIHVVDRGTILVLVYTSFCDSMKQGVWSGHGASSLVATLIGTALIFAIVLSVTRAVCKAGGLSQADQSAVVFCGSKKTLASGVPMAHLIFGQHPGLGLILLPIMIYHPLQLVVCGWLAGRWAKAEDGRRETQGREEVIVLAE